MDLFSQENIQNNQKNNVPEFSVSEISRSIKMLIEDSFGYVKIRGEISGFKQAASGHCYFSLKDENALISAVCFRGAFSKVDFKIEDGLEVYIFGKVTTYEGRSNYQIIVQDIKIAGIGALMDLIEKRRKLLLAEGLFEEKHKKKLPFWPNKIGVITSPTGAVIEDIIHRIRDRFPTNILLYPSSVQGKNAHNEVINGIKYFNSLKQEDAPDLIIIARGGGSFEDLLPFNEEKLVREVFASNLPIISAVGHETDTTLIDYVSDVRAPTPSAAAEIVTPMLSELKNIIFNLDKRLNSYISNNLNEKERNLLNISKNLIHPKKILEQSEQRIIEISQKLEIIKNNYFANKARDVEFLSSFLKSPDQLLEIKQSKVLFLFDNLQRNFDKKVTNFENRLNLATKLFDSYHYKKVLKRGYAIIRDENKKVISDANLVSKNKEINIELDNGNFDAITK